MTRILLSGGHVISMDTTIGDIRSGDVLIDEGVLVYVGPSVPTSNAEVVDTKGKIVLPGFVDTHRHTWETAIRGCGPDDTLDDYNSQIAKYQPVYRPEDVYASNLAGALDCIYSGITTLVDWSHINHSGEYADAAINGLLDAAIRAQYAYGPPPTLEYWFRSSLPMPANDIRRVRSQYFNSSDGLLTMGLATRGPTLTSDEVVISDWALARELGIPITCHVGHGRQISRFAMVDQLDRLGLLAEDTTYVHGCLLGDGEWAKIRDSGGTVSLAPQVEMQMGHGHPPLRRCLSEGIITGLSIDVVTAVPGDMFTQMRAAMAAQRDEAYACARRDGVKVPQDLVSSRKMLELATLNGAQVAGLADRTGSLTPGKRADVIVIDASTPNMVPLIDPVAAVVASADVSNVEMVIIDGIVRKRDGQLTSAFDRARQLVEDSRNYLLSATEDA
jgi:5-methylthioadenosine/S-adenosylhomocysteine deaminase